MSDWVLGDYCLACRQAIAARFIRRTLNARRSSPAREVTLAPYETERFEVDVDLSDSMIIWTVNGMSYRSGIGETKFLYEYDPTDGDRVEIAAEVIDPYRIVSPILSYWASPGKHQKLSWFVNRSDN